MSVDLITKHWNDDEMIMIIMTKNEISNKTIKFFQIWSWPNVRTALVFDLVWAFIKSVPIGGSSIRLFLGIRTTFAALCDCSDCFVQRRRCFSRRLWSSKLTLFVVSGACYFCLLFKIWWMIFLYGIHIMRNYLRMTHLLYIYRVTYI